MSPQNSGGSYRMSHISLPHHCHSSDRVTGVQEPTPVKHLKVRSLPALSSSMPMWDVLQLFKIGRAHMAVLCEAAESAPPPTPPLICWARSTQS